MHRTDYEVDRSARRDHQDARDHDEAVRCVGDRASARARRKVVARDQAPPRNQDVRRLHPVHKPKRVSEARSKTWTPPSPTRVCTRVKGLPECDVMCIRRPRPTVAATSWRLSILYATVNATPSTRNTTFSVWGKLKVGRAAHFQFVKRLSMSPNQTLGIAVRRIVQFPMPQHRRTSYTLVDPMTVCSRR